MYNLDFEKPLAEFVEKIKKFKDAGPKDKDEVVARKLRMLESQMEELKQQIYGNLNRWQRVQISRHPERPNTLEYISNLTDDFTEFHGDRNFGDDKSVVGGFAFFEGKSVMIIGTQKGRNTKENQFRNFGMPNPEGYRKALRLMKLAEKFGKPVITLVDTPGASSGLESEERGQAEAIQQNISGMLKLRVPVISIITGEGTSAGALALAVADRVLMLENSWYSVISPEICSSILWHNWDFRQKAAEELKLTAQDQLSFNLIDGIIPEPLGGAHQDIDETYWQVKQSILSHLNELEKTDIKNLIENRIQKFTSVGMFKVS